MDIHKPKPWHGLREFLKEYLIIVVGVLTALAGEQAVEWVHRQEEVGEAREALRDEMGHDMTIMQISLDFSPCFQRRLDGVTAWANGGPPPRPDKGAFDTLNSSAWDEAKTAAVGHMPLKERIAYDRFYALVADRGDVLRAVRASMVTLAGYISGPQLAPEDRGPVRQDVARIKAQMGILEGYDRYMTDMAKAMGAKSHPYTPQMVDRVAQVCDRKPTAPGG